MIDDKCIGFKDPIVVHMLNSQLECHSLVKKVAYACHICTHSDIDSFDYDDLDKCNELIRRVMDLGHHSVLRHANFTFLVTGASRNFTHQQVRHVAGINYSQQSQRYTKLSETDNDFYVIPASIGCSDFHRIRYENFVKSAKDFYREMIDYDIPAEDARYVLPSATKSNIMITANGQSLHNLFKARLCNRAQWEIRYVTQLIYEIVKMNVPSMFDCFRSNCSSCKERCENPIGDV